MSPRKKPRRFYRRKSKKSVGKKSDGAKNAILDTLSYRSVFEYPLSAYHLFTYLVSEKKIDRNSFARGLESLVRREVVSIKDGKYYLYGSNVVDWKKRGKSATELLKEFLEVCKVLRLVPWIQFIGVTGAVSARNASNSDDVDILIITKPNRLWLTRGFVFTILIILRKLRSDENPERTVCPNIFMDERNLVWARSKRNIYIAHEIAMIRPVVDRNQAYLRLLRANSWVLRLFNNLHIGFPKSRKIKASRNFIMNLVEHLAYRSQTVYMHKRKTKEITKKDRIHFLRADMSDKIVEEYGQIRKKYRKRC